MARLQEKVEGWGVLVVGLLALAAVPVGLVREDLTLPTVATSCVVGLFGLGFCLLGWVLQRDAPAPWWQGTAILLAFAVALTLMSAVVIWSPGYAVESTSTSRGPNTWGEARTYAGLFVLMALGLYGLAFQRFRRDRAGRIGKDG